MATYSSRISTVQIKDEIYSDFTLEIVMGDCKVLSITPEDGVLNLNFDPEAEEGTTGLISWNPHHVFMILHKSGDGNGFDSALRFPFDETFRQVLRTWKRMGELVKTST